MISGFSIANHIRIHYRFSTFHCVLAKVTLSALSQQTNGMAKQQGPRAQLI